MPVQNFWYNELIVAPYFVISAESSGKAIPNGTSTAVQGNGNVPGDKKEQ